MTGIILPSCARFYPFQDGSGTVLTDRIGGSNGTLSVPPATPTWDSGGINGTCLSFDGGDSVSLPNIDTSYVTSFSVEVWVYFSTTPVTYMTVWGKYLVTNNYGNHFIYYDPFRNLFSFAQTKQGVGSGEGISAGTYTPSSVNGRWFHVIGVADGAAHTLQMYVNGTQGTSGASTASWLEHTTPSLLGYYGAAMPLTGKIGLFRTYNAALSTKQASLLYHSTKGAYLL